MPNRARKRSTPSPAAPRPETSGPRGRRCGWRRRRARAPPAAPPPAVPRPRLAAGAANRAVAPILGEPGFGARLLRVRHHAFVMAGLEFTGGRGELRFLPEAIGVDLDLARARHRHAHPVAVDREVHELV